MVWPALRPRTTEELNRTLYYSVCELVKRVRRSREFCRLRYEVPEIEAL